MFHVQLKLLRYSIGFEACEKVNRGKAETESVSVISSPHLPLTV